MDRLNVAIALIPSESIPEEVRRCFERAPDSVCRHDGYLFLRLDGEALSCRDNEEGYHLLTAVQRKNQHNPAERDGEKELWYQLLTSRESEKTALYARKNGIDRQKKRTVILFQMKYTTDRSLYAIFTENAPMEEDDQAVSISRDTLALIKHSSYRSESEIAEYAAAVIDTMASEGFPELQAGIGTEAENITELHRSYEEAQNALLTGRRYHGNDSLFRYSEQKLERIIDQIPPENRKKIVEDFYASSNGEPFSAEMMETIRVFFRNDLSITSASRQLFIHRNTLNYRLDKIKRDTGLDLRTFEDAVIFRLISEMTDKDKNID